VRGQVRVLVRAALRNCALKEGPMFLHMVRHPRQWVRWALSNLWWAWPELLVKAMVVGGAVSALLTGALCLAVAYGWVG